MSGAWPPWARPGGRTAARRPASSGTSTAIRAWRWGPAPAGGPGNPQHRREGPAVADMLIDLEGPRHDPAEGRQPRALVVFLHGLGADGHDLISLAPMLAPLGSEEHTSELQSLMRISYAVFCLNKKRHKSTNITVTTH